MIIDLFRPTIEWIKDDFKSNRIRFIVELLAWAIIIGCSITMALTVPTPPLLALYPVWIFGCALYAHKIPFLVKINHNEFLSMPNQFDQTMYGSVEDAWNMGAVAVRATVYFGAEESRRQLLEVAEAFERARELGMATVLWTYTRNTGFKQDGVDYHSAADLTGQAIHLGVTIQADIIKQKLPTNNGGYNATKHGKTHPKVYTDLSSDHPIDLTRYQVLNCYAGRVGLINSGGESKGASDLAEAVTTAVINKRAGGQGLILGRKAFQRPMKEGIDLLRTIQDVYLDSSISIA